MKKKTYKTVCEALVAFMGYKLDELQHPSFHHKTFDKVVGILKNNNILTVQQFIDLANFDFHTRKCIDGKWISTGVCISDKRNLKEGCILTWSEAKWVEEAMWYTWDKIILQSVKCNEFEKDRHPLELSVHTRFHTLCEFLTLSHFTKILERHRVHA